MLEFSEEVLRNRSWSKDKALQIVRVLLRERRLFYPERANFRLNISYNFHHG